MRDEDGSIEELLRSTNFADALLARPLNQGCAPGSADGSPPLNLAGGAAQAHRNQIIALGSGEENAIPRQNGAGLPAGSSVFHRTFF
jgi:hypothetical protein